MKAWRKAPSLLCISFHLYGFFSFLLLLEKKKMLGENVWNKRAEMGRQKWKPKVRGQSGSLKESSLPSLHFFYSLWFSFLFFFFLLLEKKKMLGESVWNKKVEVGAKSEKAEWELESKFPPFSWFFLLLFCVFCLLCVWKEEEDGNVLSSSFVMVLQKRKRWQHIVIVFFCGAIETKKVMTTSYRCLLRLWEEEEKEEDNMATRRCLLLW